MAGVLGEVPRLVQVQGLKLLAVEEATSRQSRLVELALAGGQIQIRRGSGVGKLRAAEKVRPVTARYPAPREARRHLAADGPRTPSQAEQDRNEVREERLA